MVTHANILRLVQDCAFADLGPGTVTLHAASPAFDATTLEVWGPLVNGGAIAPLRRAAGPRRGRRRRSTAHGVTTLWLTAGLFHALVDRRPDALARVDHVLAGGDVVSPAHVERALAALPPGGRFTNGYGPTEGTTFTTTWTLRRGDPRRRPAADRPAGPGTACHVMDARGRELPDGVDGRAVDRRRRRRRAATGRTRSSPRSASSAGPAAGRLLPHRRPRPPPPPTARSSSSAAPTAR